MKYEDIELKDHIRDMPVVQMFTFTSSFIYVPFVACAQMPMFDTGIHTCTLTNITSVLVKVAGDHVHSRTQQLYVPRTLLRAESSKYVLMY